MTTSIDKLDAGNKLKTQVRVALLDQYNQINEDVKAIQLNAESTAISSSVNKLWPSITYYLAIVPVLGLIIGFFAVHYVAFLENIIVRALSDNIL